MARYSQNTPGSLVEALSAGYARCGVGKGVGEAGSSLLLAVSGGPDSMALLDATARLAEPWGLRLEVATVDHRLRVQSAAEVALVGRACRRRRLPFHALAAPIAPGAGVEARAREARYRALEEARAGARLDRVVTAHTANDQAETLLMRLSRGSALGGAAGVLEQRGKVIRPLLTCTREEVLAYVKSRRLTHCADAMNEDRAFFRVRVRKDVLPALAQAAGHQVAAPLARFARLAAEDDALLEGWAQAAFERLQVEEAALDLVGVKALPGPLRRRVLKALLGRLDLPVDAALLERLDAVLGVDGGAATLAKGRVLRAAGSLLRVEVDASQAQGRQRFAGTLVRGGPPLPLPASALVLRWREAACPTGVVHPLPAPGQVQLTVRYRTPGDRVLLPGGRSRKLQDVLVDAKVPRERRDLVPLLVDLAGRVVCAVGVWPKGGQRAAGGWVCASPLLAGRAGGGPLRYNPGQG